MNDDSISQSGFSKEVPSSHNLDKKSFGLKVVGIIVFWLIIIGIFIMYWPLILGVVVCTGGIGAIPLIIIGILLFRFYKWMFKH